MTPTEQRIAIAKAVGVKQKPEHFFDGRCDNRYFECEQCGETQSWREYKRDGKHPSGPCSNTRDNYPEDLNAMHEAIASLPSSRQEWLWLVELPKIIGLPAIADGDSWWRIQCPELLFSATAAQLAEAFLKTLSLWNPQTNESLPQ